MKRLLFVVVLFVAMLCTTIEARAQFDLGKAFGALLEQQSTSKPKDPLAAIAEAAPSSREVVRTWGYERIFFEYLGANPLADMAMQQLDVTVQAALKREGIVPGSFSLTLRRNGTGFIIFKEYAIDGRYDYIEEKGRATFIINIEGVDYQCGGFMKMRGDNLVVMLDAGDIFDIIVAAYPEYRNDSTALTMQGLLESFKGIFISLEFHKM